MKSSMEVQYRLFKMIAGFQSREGALVQIPAGEVLHAPANCAKTGVIEVRFRGERVKVMAIDLIGNGVVEKVS